MFKLTISLSQVIMNPLALVKQLLTVINVRPGYKTQYFNLISAVVSLSLVNDASKHFLR